MMVFIDEERVRIVAEKLRELGRVPCEMDLYDEKYYPPRNADRELVARYFLVMVAMDHRLSRPNRPYEAVVSGEKFHGADLLYRLGALMLEEDPDWFSPERLARVTASDVKQWLSADTASPPDPEVRAELLRDLGRVLLSLYDGSVLRLLEESGGMLRRGVAEGLLDRLRIFKAYMDPVEKKSHLLAKFLERRGVIRIGDPQHKRVPVDNHVTRLALRVGIVCVKRSMLDKILRQEEFSYEEDVLLRITVREAWHLVCEEAGLDDYLLDDFLWVFGRSYCTRGKPRCTSSEEKECPLKEVCATASTGLVIDEHNYYETWYY